MFRFTECDFGVTEQNSKWNTYSLDVSFITGQTRIIFEKCRFRVPAAFAPSATYDWWGSGDKERLWALGMPSASEDWRYREKVGEYVSFEFIDCQLLTAAGADRWSTIYPNTNVVGFVVGGGEIHKVSAAEVAGYRDGTFARKLLPFRPEPRSHMTAQVPIKIPVRAGETITASLYFKKNISEEELRRPQLHLYGCGVEDVATMSDAVDTWEQLTVSGTATVGGTVNLWVSCHGVPDYYVAAPARREAVSYQWAYPIDPGGTGLGVGVPDNLILYCDELNVEIS